MEQCEDGPESGMIDRVCLMIDRNYMVDVGIHYLYRKQLTWDSSSGKPYAAFSWNTKNNTLHGSDWNRVADFPNGESFYHRLHS